MFQTEFVLLSVVFIDVTPIAVDVSVQVFEWMFPRLPQCSECTGSGHNSAGKELLRLVHVRAMLYLARC